MTDREFLNAQIAAVERMKEMNSRSRYQNQNPHPMPPVPSFVNIPENKNQRSDTSFGHSVKHNPPKKDTAPNNVEKKVQKPKSATNNGIFGLPFLDKILKDSDTTLIIGLLLLLMSENADKKLLFALVYILI